MSLSVPLLTSLLSLSLPLLTSLLSLSLLLLTSLLSLSLPLLTSLLSLSLPLLTSLLSLSLPLLTYVFLPYTDCVHFLYPLVPDVLVLCLFLSLVHTPYPCSPPLHLPICCLSPLDLLPLPPPPPPLACCWDVKQPTTAHPPPLRSFIYPFFLLLFFFFFFFWSPLLISTSWSSSLPLPIHCSSPLHLSNSFFLLAPRYSLFLILLYALFPLPRLSSALLLSLAPFGVSYPRRPYPSPTFPQVPSPTGVYLAEDLGPVSRRPTTVKWRQFSQSNRHSTIGTRQTQYHEALPSSANDEVRCDCTFTDDGNASWCLVCRVPMVEWRLDCENCRHLTVVGLHDTGPWFRSNFLCGPFSRWSHTFDLTRRVKCSNDPYSPYLQVFFTVISIA